MDAQAARDILEDTKSRYDEKNLILKGMTLLAEVDPDLDTNTEMAAEHDQIWVGDFDRSVARMTEEQVRQMGAWGWYCNMDSWSHFA